MDENSGKSEGDDSEPQAGDGTLPVVWSPRLSADEPAIDASPVSDAGEAAASPDDTVGDHASEPAPTSPPRSWRFAMLAGSVALAAALGSFIGVMSALGIEHITSAPGAPASAIAAVGAVPTSSAADTGSLLRAMKSQSAELAAIKAVLDGAVRSTNVQYASISDRLDRVEHFADPAMAVKLAHIAETVDRLDRLNTAPETTSSIATATPAAPAAALPAAALPAAALPADPKITDRILQDWAVQDVRGDRALVESRYGGVFDVGVGSVLPGLGRVQSVKRQDGQWIVITERGSIISAH